MQRLTGWKDSKFPYLHSDSGSDQATEVLRIKLERPSHTGAGRKRQRQGLDKSR